MNIHLVCQFATISVIYKRASSEQTEGLHIKGQLFTAIVCMGKEKYMAASDHFEPRADSYRLIPNKLLFQKNT